MRNPHHEDCIFSPLSGLSFLFHLCPDFCFVSRNELYQITFAWDGNQDGKQTECNYKFNAHVHIAL